MTLRKRQNGFSLTETLLAVGTLAIGMLFVAGTFVTGVRFAELSTKRSVAAVAADEAFTKIALYGDPNTSLLNTDGFAAYENLRAIPEAEYRYPSTGDPNSGPYSWSALCRRIGDDSQLMQCIVFISRDVGNNGNYQYRDEADETVPLEQSRRPRATLVALSGNAADLQGNEVQFHETVPEEQWRLINDGARIVDDRTGQIYRVLERYADPLDNRLKLDRPWAEGPVEDGPQWVWVIPPPTSSGRSPFVAIYQKVLRF
jgi:hypothetical protein